MVKNFFRASCGLDQHFTPLFTTALDTSPVARSYSPPLTFFLDPPLRLGGPGGAVQLIREAGGGVCDVANCRSSLTVYSFTFVVASFLSSPTPSFSSLTILQATYGKQ